jgi:RimJ/RimL family protein N-acetyltransferase
MPIELPQEVRHGRAMLRPLRAEDADAYAAAFADDPELGRLLGLEKDPVAGAIAERAAEMAQIARADRFVELAVGDEDGAFAGSVTLHSFALQHRRCEVGFWLVPAARGQGLGSDAVAAAVDWVFGTLDLLRLEMTTTPDNPAVPAVARRLGFVREGTQRKRNVERGERIDVVLFGLLREDWSTVS